MGKLISIRQYFNRLGQEMYSDWSTKTVHYFTGRGIKDEVLRKRAKIVYRKAKDQIFIDGKVKVSAVDRQGFIDPPFTIDNFNFYYSTCSDEKYNQIWKCALEIKIENRGAPERYAFVNSLIIEYVEKEYVSKGISTKNIKAVAVVNYIQEYCVKKNFPVPSKNTVIDRLHLKYPECKKSNK